MLLQKRMWFEGIRIDGSLRKVVHLLHMGSVQKVGNYLKVCTANRKLLVPRAGISPFISRYSCLSMTYALQMLCSNEWDSKRCNGETASQKAVVLILLYFAVLSRCCFKGIKENNLRSCGFSFQINGVSALRVV